MIDTHSHIFSEEFDEDRQRVVTEAIDVGVRNVILANVDSSTIDRLDTTQERHAKRMGEVRSYAEGCGVLSRANDGIVSFFDFVWKMLDTWLPVE